MQNYSCGCLNVLIRAAPSSSMNPDELNSARGAIERETCPELAALVQSSRLVKIGHQLIQIQHPYLCAHKVIGNGSWSVCVCWACHQVTHAVRISGSQMDMEGSGQLFLNDSQATDSLDGLVLVHSKMLNDDQAIESLRSSPNFSPVFNILVPAAQLTSTDCSALLSRTLSTNSMESSDGQPRGRLDSVGSSTQEWTPPSSLTSTGLVPQISDSVRAYLKREQEAKDERIKAFLLEQERAFDSLCQSVQLSKVNFVHLVDSLQRRRHYSADNDKENRGDPKDFGRRSVSSNVNAGNVAVSNNNNNNNNGADTGNNVTSPGVKDAGNYFLSTIKNQHQHQPQQRPHQHQQHHQAIQQLQQQQFQPQQQPQKCKPKSQPQQKRHAGDYDDGGFQFQMDDIDATAGGGDCPDFNIVQEEPEDELPDFDNENVNFASLSQIQHPVQNRSAGLAVAGDRIRKVSNVRDVPFSYRDSRMAARPFGGISLPIPIPVHLQAHRNEPDDDKSTEEGDIADRMMAVTRSVRGDNENFQLLDRPRRRLNTCDLIHSNRRAYIPDQDNTIH